MPSKVLFAITAIALGQTAAAARAASPDDPGAPVRADRYRPVTSGTKSYRPVEPLPWGDVNRRVAPKAKGGEDGTMPRGKGAPEHKH